MRVYSDEQIATAKKLLSQNFSYKEVQEATGIEKGSLYYYARKVGREVQQVTTPEEVRAKAVQMYKDGLPIKEIVADTGLHKATIRKMADDAGLPPRKKPVQYTPEQAARAVDLYLNSKMKVMDICKKVGIDKRVLYKHLRQQEGGSEN